MSEFDAFAPLVKLISAALTISQVAGPQGDIRPQFDPQADQTQVVQILNSGCQLMMKEFGAESIDFDVLFTTLIANSERMNTVLRIKEGLDLKAVAATYRRLCKGDPAAIPGVEFADVIRHYNLAVKDLPDPARLKGMKLPEATAILDGSDRRFTEIYKDDGRRRWVSLAQIPDHVQKAFIAAEDKRFSQHKGIDMRGIIRAFMANIGDSGRPQGGSTITQQVVKNLLVGDDVTTERKIREIAIAVRLERLLSKNEILELYLNYIFLGRSSWGVEMAAQSYFGKSVGQLSVAEAAALAALTKGPAFYNPDTQPARFNQRIKYVVDRMKEDQYITAEQATAALTSQKAQVTSDFQSPRSRRGFYALDDIMRTVRDATGQSPAQLAGQPLTIRSTLHRELQTATENALQEGLARFETRNRRAAWDGPEANIASQISRISMQAMDRLRTESQEGDGSTQAQLSRLPPWRQVLMNTRPRLYDLGWPVAVVIDVTRQGLTVGLADGRTMGLRAWDARVLGSLKFGDVVHVRVTRDTKTNVEFASLRHRPDIQGSVLVMENSTGRILAQTGGFSYALSQLNRATQTQRQPGSTVKPLTYLIALQHGLQPNTVVSTESLRLESIDRDPSCARRQRPSERCQQAWEPSGARGAPYMTMRQGLEQSNNFVTTRLMAQMSQSPVQALDYIRELSRHSGLYRSEPVRYYPFILGAQEARLVDVVTFYATIANGGWRPTPQILREVSLGDRKLFESQANPLQRVALVDEVSFEQMRSLLAGTLVRGTASRMRDLAGVVAGKTGTTNSAADVWFVGFTNDVTIGVWLGYDNDSRESRRTLGDDATGGQWAVPIFEEIVRASFASYKPKTNLRGPRAELAAQTVVVRTSSRTGDMVETGDLSELYRMDTRNRQPFQSQYRFVSRDEHLAALEAPASPDRTNPNQGWGAVSEEPGSPGRPLDLRPRPVQPKAPRPWWEIFFGAAEDDRDTQRARQRRYDPMFRYERPSDGTSNN